MKLVAVIAASLLAVGAFAQSATVESQSASAGLIGKRYVDAGFGWIDIRHGSEDLFGAGLSVNVPVHANFDVSLDYSHSYITNWTNLSDYLGTSITGYVPRGDSKYFARVALGYSWAQSWASSDHAVWGTDVGIERAVNDKVSATFSVGYDDDFGQHRDGLWDVSVGGTYAFTSKIVGTAEISYIEYGDVGYSLGMAYRF
jgi:hypothetical protein